MKSLIKVTRGTLAIWAIVWSAGVVVAAVGEGAPAAPYAASIVILIAAPTVLAFVSPRIGGSLLIAGGVFAVWFFSNPGALWLLALPAIALGILVMALGPHPKQLA